MAERWQNINVWFKNSTSIVLQQCQSKAPFQGKGLNYIEILSLHSGGASFEEFERNGKGDSDVIFQSEGIPNYFHTSFL